jgi:hypothetical protein
MVFDVWMAGVVEAAGNKEDTIVAAGGAKSVNCIVSIGNVVLEKREILTDLLVLKMAIRLSGAISS